MSQENVEIARRSFDLFNNRELDAWWNLMDEDVEWHSRADEPDADVYHGREGIERLAATWMEMFPDVRLELAGESIDLGDQVVTPTFLVGKARMTGIEVREPYSWLATLREGKFVVIREFRSNAAALKAVGLAE